jgi:hypothetical protein
MTSPAPWFAVALLTLAACSSSSSTSAEDDGGAPAVGSPGPDAAATADGDVAGDDQGDAGAGDASSPRGDGGGPVVVDAAGHDATPPDAAHTPLVAYCYFATTNTETELCGDNHSVFVQCGPGLATRWSCFLDAGANPCPTPTTCAEADPSNTKTGLAYGETTHSCDRDVDCSDMNAYEEDAGSPVRFTCKANVCRS